MVFGRWGACVRACVCVCVCARAQFIWLHWLLAAACGTSLVVQKLRLQASTTGGLGSISGQGAKIPYAMQYSSLTPQKRRRSYSLNVNSWPRRKKKDELAEPGALPPKLIKGCSSSWIPTPSRNLASITKRESHISASHSHLVQWPCATAKTTS